MIKRIIILGPTGSGKTSLSIILAQQIGAEIISADSRQCYKRLDIGTDKPDENLLESVPHHNISLLDPAEPDSVAGFLSRAEKWTEEILERGSKVIYAGGSTLHLQGLIQPFDDLPESDPENVAELNRKAGEAGVEALYRELETVDPQYAADIQGMNPRQIIRALDVWKQTGKPFSSFHTRGEPVVPDDMLVFGLDRRRERLYERINIRVDAMIKKGLREETENLLSEGYSPALQAFQTVGYRQVIRYLEGELTREEMIDKIKQETRRYAKRQLTWFRKWPFIHWLDADNLAMDEMAEIIRWKTEV